MMRATCDTAQAYCHADCKYQYGRPLYDEAAASSRVDRRQHYTPIHVLLGLLKPASLVITDEFLMLLTLSQPVGGGNISAKK